MESDNRQRAAGFLAIFVLTSIITLVLNPFSALNTQTDVSNSQQGQPGRYGPPSFLVYIAQEKGVYEKNSANVELLFDPDYFRATEKYALGDADGITIEFSEA